MAVGREEAEVQIVKPRTDKREYRRIILKNSLEVLLISDLDTDKVNNIERILKLSVNLNVSYPFFCRRVT